MWKYGFIKKDNLFLRKQKNRNNCSPLIESSVTVVAIELIYFLNPAYASFPEVLLNNTGTNGVLIKVESEDI